MKRTSKTCLALLLAVSATWIASTKTFAANGTWTNTTSGGLWSDTANWSGGTVADGSGFSADFSTIDITADNTVHMDTAHTLTSLIFGDTDTSTAAGWTLDNNANAANILTLAGTTPSITVNALGTGKSATISAVLAGSTAWSKAGAGTLTLSGGSGSSITGAATISGGTLVIKGGTALSNLRASITINAGQTNQWDATGIGGAANSDTMGSYVGHSVTISGTGTLLITGNSTDFLGLGNNTGTPHISLGSGGLIDIEGGNLRNGGWGGGVWTANLASMNIASGAEFDVWDSGNTVYVDALTGSGNIQNQSNGGSTPRPVRVGVNNGSGTFSGVIGGGTRSGANYIAIVKAGSGTQTLSGANTYVGGTTLSAGQLNINNGGSGGTSSAIGNGPFTISGVSTIDNTSAGDVTISPTIAQSWNADFTYAGSVHNLNLGTGAVTMNATRQVTVSANTLTVGGAISGTGFGLTKAGSGTLALSGANTYTGNTTVSAGTLLLNGSTASGSTVSVSGNGSVLGGSGTINGATTISSSGALTPRPSAGSATTTTFGGDLTLSSASANFTVSSSGIAGNDQVVYGSSGTLTLDSSDTINITGATLDTANDYTLFTSTGGTVSMATTPTLKINGVTSDQTSAGSYQLVASGSLLKLHYIPTATPATVNSQSASPSSIGHHQTTTVTVNVTASAGNVTNLTVTLDGLAGAGDPVSLTGPGGNGSGNWTGTFTAATSLAAGSYIISGTAEQDNGANIGWSVSVTVTNSGSVWSGSGADNKWSTVGNWNSNLSPGPGDYVSFAGSTQLTNNLDASLAVGSLTFNSGAGSFDITNAASTLTLTGGLTNNSANVQTLDVPVALSGAQTISAAAGNVAINGAVSDSGAGLTLTGSGTLTLSAANASYSGPTTIGSGTLAIAGSGTLGSGTYSAVITNDGALNYDSSASQTLSGIISGTGSVTNNGSGTLILSGANTYGGGATINAGLVEIQNTTALGTGTVTLAGGTLQVGGADLTIANNIVAQGSTTSTLNTSGRNLTINGNISGSGNINRAAPSSATTITLNGDDSGYTGTFTQANSGNAVVSFTSVNAGSAGASWVFQNPTGGRTRLGLGGNGVNGTISFGSMTGNGVLSSDVSGTKTISAGALSLNDTFSGSIQNGSGTVALTKVGTGTMTLSGANTYTGNTTISAGTLALSGSGSIANSPNITVDTNATFDVSAVTGGSYSLNGSGTLTLNIAKTGAILTNGQVTATSLTAGGTLAISASGDALADGDTFTLFNVQPSGTFAATNLPAPGASANWWTANNYQTLTYNVWPTAGNPAYTHAKGVQWKIAIADLLTNVTGAVSGKTITLTGVGAPGVSGATAQIYGGYVIYTPGPSDANDSFTYSVADGRGGSATGTINVIADTSSLFGQQSPQLTADGSGQVNVKFYGVPGYSYYIQRADDVGFTVNVTELGPYSATTGNPVISTTDTISPNGQAYYRLEWKP